MIDVDLKIIIYVKNNKSRIFNIFFYILYQHYYIKWTKLKKNK
jgi:hypothetical protein